MRIPLHPTRKSIKRSAPAIARVLAVMALVVSSFALAATTYAAEPVSADDATDRRKPEPGILIVRVDDASPAAEAGLQRGDILLAINGDAVNTVPELRFVLQTFEPGDVIELTVKHGDEERTLSVTLGDRQGQSWLGIVPYVEHPAREFRFGQDMPFGHRGQFRMPHGPDFGLRATPLAVLPGVHISDVVPDSPAEQAGLTTDDVILAVNGEPVNTAEELIAAIGQFAPGDVVTLEVQSQDQETRTVDVTLDAHPDDPSRGFLGIQVAPPQAAFKTPSFQGEMNLGVIIRSVQDGSPAQEAGLQAGDVITAVNGEPLANPAALVQLVADTQPGDELTLTVERDGAEPQDVVVVAGENEQGKAYLGIQIGGLRLRERSDFRGKGEQGYGHAMPHMPFWGQPNGHGSDCGQPDIYVFPDHDGPGGMRRFFQTPPHSPDTTQEPGVLDDPSVPIMVLENA